MFTLDNNLCNMPHKHKCLKRKWVCKNQILWPKKCWFWNHFKYCLSNTKHPLTKKLLHIIGACMRATCIVYNASWCQRIWWSAILKFYVACSKIIFVYILALRAFVWEPNKMLDCTLYSIHGAGLFIPCTSYNVSVRRGITWDISVHIIHKGGVLYMFLLCAHFKRQWTSNNCAAREIVKPNDY